VNDGLTRYATGDRQLFRRRTGGWEVELLPGWDAVEDILGAALVSREPRREGAAFRTNINVVESPEILPEDVYAFAEQQAELLREAGVEPHDLMVRLPDENESSLKPGQMAVRVQSRSNIQGAIVEQETIWVGLGSACLIFTLMAEEAEYGAKQEAMLSVPRSLKLHAGADADGNQVIG